MEENRHGVIAEALKLWAQGGTRASGATTNPPMVSYWSLKEGSHGVGQAGFRLHKDTKETMCEGYHI